MKKCTLLAAAAAIATAHAALAASPLNVTTSADGRLSYAHPGAPSYTPPLAHKKNIPAIFENFANSYPKGLYNSTNGASISGPHTIFGQIWLAAAFTPTANATVREVDVAAGYINGKKKDLVLHIYADASGVPGTELWSHNVSLPTFGTCCAIAAVGDKAGVKLTAGTQYWIGLTTLSSGTDTMAAWNLEVLDQVDSGNDAQNRGTGWQPGQFQPNFAFGVYGQ